MPFTHPARAIQRIRLGIGHAANGNYGMAGAAMAESVQARTDGRIQIEVFADGVLGSEEAMLAATRDGSLELTIVASGLLGAYAPEIGLLDMPFLFRDVAHARDVLDGPVGHEYAELANAAGSPVLGWAENGARHLTANRPIRNAADLQGLKLRIMPAPVLIESFIAMGAAAGSLSGTMLYEALRIGTFDAEENPIPIIYDFKLYEVQSHLMLTGHTYSAACIAVSPDFLEDLGEPDRQALVAAARDGITASRDFIIKAEPVELLELQRLGMTIVADIDRASFAKLAEKAFAAAAKRFGAERIARLRSA